MSSNSFFGRLRAPRRPRRVVYTALFGYSEFFNDFTYRRDDIDFICFTDDPELKSDFWTVKVLPAEFLDPARMAKQVKALPHRFLPDHDWSLYIDNTVRLKAAPSKLFEEFLGRAPSPHVCFHHPERDCVYDEAAEVAALGYDDPRRVSAQIALYRRMGYPPNNGLAKGTFMLRRHRDPTLIAVMERWYQQILLFSLRDQLSLNPAAWLSGFSLSYLDRRFDRFELLEWPLLKNNVRLPRDFDDARYLALNPDVPSHARHHYLLHGAKEGRRYR